MSARMLLLLTFVGCCMAALLDEQDVDTRTVDSLLTYLDHEMTSDLSDDEFMHYIVTNATISNETYHVIEESAG
ncbi:hypothetical protein KP79_PYT10893 [Mizuhopecten yessoensis]|uniref:Uncharacterized protein n=1 Tax=Mizuhopecten yessoensis TaxID=6573 RepID=A0A210Q245_MIZYE|nr:hypothetical protein KP79_PYT10893 [Mizuhopecten yessoensis]